MNRKGEKADWVVGLNVLTDDLKETPRYGDAVRDYHYTYGIFIQNAWAASERFTLEAGLRGDYVNEYGFELLPRVSAMLRISPAITTRLGGGFGYKTPTMFTEESERIQFQNLLPIDIDNSKNERSIGGNWDINFRTTIGEIALSLNHLFFYTRLNRPLVLIGAPGGKIAFQNSTGYVDTKGMKTIFD